MLQTNHFDPTGVKDIADSVTNRLDELIAFLRNFQLCTIKVAESGDEGRGASQARDGEPQLLQDRGASVQRPRQPRERIQKRG